MTNPTTPPPDAGRPEIDTLIRKGCTAADIHLTCSWPECVCTQMPAAIRSVVAMLAPPREVTEAMVELALDEWMGLWRDSRYADQWKEEMTRALTAALNAPVRVHDALDERGLDHAIRVLRQAWDQSPINDPPSYATVREAFNVYFEVVAEGLGNLPATTERSSATERAAGESPALSAALNAPARVAENALNELLEPLSEPWEYKGSDVAWQILYRWHKTMQNSNGSAKDAVMSLFLRADGGGLHLLARAINAAFNAPARVDGAKT